MARIPPIARLLACALGAVLLAVSVQAEEAPGCWWDPVAQSLSRQGSDAANYPAWSSPVGNKFATTFVDHLDAANWNILYHCPSDNHLVVYAKGAAQAPVNTRFLALMESDQPYTMHQIADELSRAGATVTLGKGDVGNCPCVHLQSIGALK